MVTIVNDFIPYPDQVTITYGSKGLMQASGTTTTAVDGTTIVLNGSNKIALNLANANTWTATQTFPVASFNNLLSNTNTWTAAQVYSDFSSINIKANLTGLGGSTNGVISWSYSGSNTYLTLKPVVELGYTSNIQLEGFVVTTINNTLDDGNGNAIFTTSGGGIVSVNGIKTTAGAATTVTVGASPYTYTNSSTSNQQIFIQGGTVSAISFNPNGGTGISLSGLTDNVITLRPGDTITITYTVAPTVNTIQL